MAASVNPNGSTNGVSGKVTASTKASGVATLVATFLYGMLDHVPALHSFFGSQPWAPALVVAALVGAVTWVAGYVAKHAPEGVVAEVKEAWTTAVNAENAAAEIPAKAGTGSLPVLKFKA